MFERQCASTTRMIIDNNSDYVGPRKSFLALLKMVLENHDSGNRILQNRSPGKFMGFWHSSKHFSIIFQARPSPGFCRFFGFSGAVCSWSLMITTIMIVYIYNIVNTSRKYPENNPWLSVNDIKASYYQLLLFSHSH